MSRRDIRYRNADPGAERDDDPLLSRCRQQWSGHATLHRSRRPGRPLWAAVAASIALALSLSLSKTIQLRPDKPKHAFAPTPPSVAVGRESAPKRTTPTEAPPPPPTQPIKSEPTPREAFKSWVDAAGAPSSRRWFDSIAQLAAASLADQRAAVAMVGQIEPAPERQRAFELVLAAARKDRHAVLRRWSSDPRVAPLAWGRVVEEADGRQLQRLADQAVAGWQVRPIVTRWLAAAPADGLDPLLERVTDENWRAAIVSAAANLPPAWTQPLVLRLRGDRRERLAAAALLSVNPDPAIDHVAIDWIIRGRYRQAAYTTLLCRRTPTANAFLQRSWREPALRPALHSAGVRFAALSVQLSALDLTPRNS